MTANAVSEATKVRIMLVEDEAVVALDVSRRLAKLGYEVPAVSATGEEAVTIAGKIAPDLILMDIMLAGVMDGIEAAAIVRERLGIPVIYLTAYADQETLKRAGATGPFGYIIKPFEDRELYTAIEMALYKSRMEQRLVESERWLSITLKSIGEGVITTDPSGRVRFLNPPAETLLGVIQDQAAGKKLSEIFRILRDKNGGTTPHSGRQARGYTYLMGPNGRRVPIEQSLSPIKDDKGRRLGTVVVFRDITSRKRSEEALRDSVENLRLTLGETVNALAVTAEKRDPYTAGHQQRVSKLATAIASGIGLSDEAREAVRVAGLLHDIGKIYVPAEILAKPARLSSMEMGIVKTHSEVGYDILKDIPFPWPVARIVLEHHERFDGSGYPGGLKADKTLIESRILAVADVVEAMSSHRPYRAALGQERALEEIRRNRGVLYDPAIVDVCLALFDSENFTF